MSFNRQEVTIVGNLTDDPVIRENNGTRRATFTVAVNIGKGENKNSLFHDMTAFNSQYDRLADNVAASLRKGVPVIVRCEPTQYKIDATINGESKQITKTAYRVLSIGVDLADYTVDATRNPRQDGESNGGAPAQQYQPQAQQAQPQYQQQPVAAAVPAQGGAPADVF